MIVYLDGIVMIKFQIVKNARFFVEAVIMGIPVWLVKEVIGLLEVVNVVMGGLVLMEVK